MFGVDLGCCYYLLELLRFGAIFDLLVCCFGFPNLCRGAVLVFSNFAILVLRHDLGVVYLMSWFSGWWFVWFCLICYG